LSARGSRRWIGMKTRRNMGRRQGVNAWDEGGEWRKGGSYPRSVAPPFKEVVRVLRRII
jgi:hypothetical protein